MPNCELWGSRHLPANLFASRPRWQVVVGHVNMCKAPLHFLASFLPAPRYNYTQHWRYILQLLCNGFAFFFISFITLSIVLGYFLQSLSFWLPSSAFEFSAAFGFSYFVNWQSGNISPKCVSVMNAFDFSSNPENSPEHCEL